MYNAKIEAHSLRDISDPRLIKEIENSNWNTLQEQIRVIVDANMFLLDGGYSVTVSYHKADY